MTKKEPDGDVYPERALIIHFIAYRNNLKIFLILKASQLFLRSFEYEGRLESPKILLNNMKKEIKRGRSHILSHFYILLRYSRTFLKKIKNVQNREKKFFQDLEFNPGPQMLILESEIPEKSLSRVLFLFIWENTSKNRGKIVSSE